MMDEQELGELNKKLAEWAGFRFRLSASENPHYWVNPKGYPVNQPPNFTHSLDACFKWLVPKLESIDGYPVIVVEKTGHCSWYCQIEGNSIDESSVAGSPALALCLAIEKLIDGGK